MRWKKGTRPLNGAMRRRRHPRVDCHGLCFAQMGGFYEGSVLDLSRSGMSLRLRRLKRVLTPGFSYFVKLFLEDGPVTVVQARVVRLIENRDEYVLGMEFCGVSQEDRAALTSFLKQRIH